jgi:hypothetical protein
MALSGDDYRRLSMLAAAACSDSSREAAIEAMLQELNALHDEDSIEALFDRYWLARNAGLLMIEQGMQEAGTELVTKGITFFNKFEELRRARPVSDCDADQKPKE